MFKSILFELFYTTIGNLFIGLFFVILLMVFLTPNSVKDRFKLPVQSINLIGLGAAFLIIANYIFLLIHYASHSSFFDHVEPNIAIVSWLFQTGKPIYHTLDSPERYSIGYGPMIYIITGFFLNSLGPSIFSAKLPGILAAVLSLVFTFYTLKKIVSLRVAIFCLAYLILNYTSIHSGFPAATFWTRSDPLILMFVSLGLLGVVRTNSLMAIILSALSLGIAINLKIHSFFYFLPIYALLYSQYGLYATFGSTLVAILIAIAPFIYFPQISLPNYILWLRALGNHGISFYVFIDNIVWTIYLLAPVIIIFTYYIYSNKTAFQHFVKQQNKFIYSLIFALSAVAIIGANVGASMNHLIPFLPVIYYFFTLTLSQATQTKQETQWKNIKDNKYYYSAFISLILSLFILTFSRVVVNEINIVGLPKRYSSDAINDVYQIEKKHPGTTIAMGYGGKYALTYYRPVLVFSGNPYLIDSVFEMDAALLGMKMPPKTFTALSSCQTKIWLIPKGDQPFQLRSFYGGEVFSDELKSTFLATYELREQTRYYDLWFCKKN